MARRRYLSTNVSTDRDVNRLALEHGDFAVMLYTWMIPHAGDDGTLTGDPEELLMTVLPGRRDKEPGDIEVALLNMVSVGLIAWDGERVMFPGDAFYRYQTYIRPDNRRQDTESPSAEEPQPAPENAAPSISTAQTAENAEKRRATAENAASFSPSFSVSPSPSVSVRGFTARARAAPEPVGDDPVPEHDVAGDVFVEGCTLMGSDPTDVKGTARSRQIKAIRAALNVASAEDVIGCLSWLLTDEWKRQRGIDFITVGESLPKWLMNGRPASVAARSSPNGVPDAADIRRRNQPKDDEPDPESEAEREAWLAKYRPSKVSAD